MKQCYTITHAAFTTAWERLFFNLHLSFFPSAFHRTSSMLDSPFRRSVDPYASGYPKDASIARADWRIYFYFIFLVIGGVGMTLLLVTMLWPSKHRKPRNPLLISLCFSWWISTFPCLCLLYYAGQVTGPPPTYGVCLSSAALTIGQAVFIVPQTVHGLIPCLPRNRVATTAPSLVFHVNYSSVDRILVIYDRSLLVFLRSREGSHCESLWGPRFVMWSIYAVPPLTHAFLVGALSLTPFIFDPSRCLNPLPSHHFSHPASDPYQFVPYNLL